ncbi:hypothetical protein ACXJJ3_32650 [Kribbella sp. WER1]
MITELFKYTDTDHSLTEDAEAAAILAAQAGDQSAMELLLRAYGPVLRAVVAEVNGGLREGAIGRFSDYGASAVSPDDLQQAAVEAVLGLIRVHDVSTSPRISGRVRDYITDAVVRESHGKSAFQIPKRTLTRYFGIIRACEGDVREAYRRAPEFSLAQETFLSILEAIGAESLSAREDEDSRDGEERAASPVFSSSPISDAEDAILVDVAFRAVDDDEERICRLSYGFTEYDPQPDAEIAHRMDLTRPTVQRKRAKALAKMRKALGVTHA